MALLFLLPAQRKQRFTPKKSAALVSGKHNEKGVWAVLKKQITLKVNATMECSRLKKSLATFSGQPVKKF